MNQTNFEHAIAAVGFQLVIGLITGDWFAGACLGFGFFFGREHAQEQDRIGYTLKQAFQAFDLRKWKLDSILDMVFPLIAVLIVYGISKYLTQYS